jgi:hypothetical protein
MPAGLGLGGSLSGRFTELHRILAAFTWAWFMGRDHTDIAEVIEVVEFAIEPGLESENLDEGTLREDSSRHLQFALAIALVHPYGRSGVYGKNRIEFAIHALESINVTAIIAVGNDPIELLKFFGQTNDATAQ